MNESNLDPSLHKPRVLLIADSWTLAHPSRMLVLAEALLCNYEVHFASRELPDLLGGLAPGAVRHLLQCGATPQDFIKALGENRLPYSKEDYARQIEEDLALIGRIKPSLVVGDARLALGITARRAKVPSVSLTNVNWSPFADDSLPACDNALTGKVPSWVENSIVRFASTLFIDRMLTPLSDAYEAEGENPPDTLAEAYCWGDFVLYPDTPWFIPLQSLPAHHAFLGPVNFSINAPLPKVLQTDAANPQYIYVSMGSSGNAAVLANVLEDLVSLDMLVIVSKAGQSISLPDSKNLVVADFVPAAEVIRNARLVVSNGGAGTNYIATEYGVASIMVTSNMDQEIGARAMERLGAGRRIRASQVKPGRVTSLAQSLFNDRDLPGRLRELATMTKKWNAPHEFRKQIDSLMKKGKLWQPTSY